MTLYQKILSQPSSDLFNAFFEAKQKKMNFEMMLLADCVTLMNNNLGTSTSDSSTAQSKQDLIEYLKSIGEVCEVKAVAYHDLA